MTSLRLSFVAIAALVLFAPQGGAVALPVAPTILVAPGGWLTQYATPAAVTTASIGLQLRNEDIMRHDAVSSDYGPDGAVWCSDIPAGRCPLFWTPLINRGATVVVQGVETLAPGTYEYFCTIHTAMRGMLVVAPDAV